MLYAPECGPCLKRQIQEAMELVEAKGDLAEK